MQIIQRWHLLMNGQFQIHKQNIFEGGSPGLVVMGGDTRSKVVSSNPGTIYCMDIFHIYLL